MTIAILTIAILLTLITFFIIGRIALAIANIIVQAILKTVSFLFFAGMIVATLLILYVVNPVLPIIALIIMAIYQWNTRK